MGRERAYSIAFGLFYLALIPAQCFGDAPAEAAPSAATNQTVDKADIEAFNTGLADYQSGDHAKAFQILKPLSDKGYTGVMYLVGLMYLYGDGTGKDVSTAYTVLGAAAAGGNARAMVAIGYMHLLGITVPSSYNDFVTWMDQAFQQNPDQAISVLTPDWFASYPRQEGAAAGYLYGKASSLKDTSGLYSSVQALASDSASKGDLLGEYFLGSLYYYGYGVDKDQVKAAALYKQSADQGFEMAENDLGVMYQSGTGVPRDYDEARKLYQLAAMQGNALGAKNTCRLYLNGVGVSIDGVEAYVWCNLAAGEGDTDAPSVLDKLQTLLTPKQIAIAQKRSRELAASIAQGNSKPAPSNNVAPDDSTDIKKAQARLLQLGYYKGKADGVIGRGTTDAISSFERDHGLAVDGEVSPTLLAALEKTEPSVQGTSIGGHGLSLHSTGTGFYVNGNGYLITNAHVVDGCKEIRASNGNRTDTLTLQAEDAADDLALLTHKGPVSSVAEFRDGGPLQVGEHLIVFGYPLPNVLSGQLTLTDGSVSALGGLGGSVQEFQFSAPIQPGNSGGPILDVSGRVVGMSVAKLNSIAVARATGDMPENVNFGINEQTLRAFLDLHAVTYGLDRSSSAVPEPRLADEAKGYTVLVECWK